MYFYNKPTLFLALALALSPFAKSPCAHTHSLSLLLPEFLDYIKMIRVQIAGQEEERGS